MAQITLSHHHDHSFPLAGTLGAAVLAALILWCFLTLPWSISRFDHQQLQADQPYQSPSWSEPFGTDRLGRSLAWRCALGGAISLSVGIFAAAIAVVIGTAWGAIAGYIGGQVDSSMMRMVDVLYGLPYILLVVLVDLALYPFLFAFMQWFFDASAAADLSGIITMILAIGSVSWLTVARVVRGQVLSLKAQPFIEAGHALGIGPIRLMRVHLLPNLVGPIVVYATLTVPSAILQESFLSFLGIGIRPPTPSWGNLAAEGLDAIYAMATDPVNARWWLLAFPCLLLCLTLMALNFLGDALRDKLDPRHQQKT